MALGDIFLIDIAKFRKLFLIPVPDFSKLYVIQLRDVALWLYYIAVIIMLYAAMTPWFAWPIHSISHFIAIFPITLSFLLSRTLRDPIFSRKDYAIPTALYALFVYVNAILRGANILGLIDATCSVMVFSSLFLISKKDLVRLGDVLSKLHGGLLATSIPFYILYLVGFRLPHYHVACPFADYTFESYFFFMVDDRDTFTLIPRFTSYFLEPAHLSMGCITLLVTQIGKWNKWYCRVMFAAIALSFSLAGYVFLAIILFGSAWMKGKAVIGKLIAIGAFMATILVGSMFYNQGDNLVNTLIVERLSIGSNGKLEGDNRVTDSFEREYDKFIVSSNVLIGEGGDKMEKFGFGNAGYRVFIYSNGLICTFILLAFFISFTATSRNRKAKVMFYLMQFVSFIPHGFPLRYYFFVPLYIMTFRDIPGMRPADDAEAEFPATEPVTDDDNTNESTTEKQDNGTN